MRQLYIIYSSIYSYINFQNNANTISKACFINNFILRKLILFKLFELFKLFK